MLLYTGFFHDASHSSNYTRRDKRKSIRSTKNKSFIINGYTCSFQKFKAHFPFGLSYIVDWLMTKNQGILLI